MARHKLEIDPALLESNLPVRTIAKLLGVFPSTVYKYRREHRGYKMDSPADHKASEHTKSWSICFPAKAAAKIATAAKAEHLKPQLWIKRHIMEMLGLPAFPQASPRTPAWVIEHSRLVATEYDLRYYIYRNAALEAIGQPFDTKAARSWAVYYDAVEDKLCPRDTAPELYEAFLAVWPHLQRDAK